MTTLYPSDLASFSRQFKFAGGRIRRVKLIASRKADPVLELILAVRTAPTSLSESPQVVLLRFRCLGVEEFRFQKRPGTKAGTITECKFGFFQDQIYINFDAWGLMPGDAPKVHDFRASDSYLACRDLKWERIEKPAKSV